jgi:hypothetical protein
VAANHDDAVVDAVGDGNPAGKLGDLFRLDGVDLSRAGYDGVYGEETRPRPDVQDDVAVPDRRADRRPERLRALAVPDEGGVVLQDVAVDPPTLTERGAGHGRQAPLGWRPWRGW